MIAQIIESDTIRVDIARTAPDGTGEITVSLGVVATCFECFEAFKALPEIIEYAGRRYAKSCYNSDRGVGVYLTSAWLFERLATVVAS